MKHNQKAKAKQPESTGHTPQPEPVTPGVTRGMVRQHAFELFRDKLAHESLKLEDWVMAEKDLVRSMETDNISK